MCRRTITSWLPLEGKLSAELTDEVFYDDPIHNRKAKFSTSSALRAPSPQGEGTWIIVTSNYPTTGICQRKKPHGQNPRGSVLF